MRSIVHFKSAVNIVTAYKGNLPFAAYLKDFFRANKKYGSSDRKLITHWCYGYFRIARAVDSSPEERLQVFLFLEGKNADLLQALNTRWTEWFNANSSADQSLRIEFLKEIYPDFELQKLFPFADKLSPTIASEAFIESHLEQPDSFIRARPGKEETVENILIQQAIPHRKIARDAFAFSSRVGLEEFFQPDKDIVVQDYSSQRTAGFFPPLPPNPSIWDCCAASGGKSILAADHYKNPKLTVTDSRKSILINLKKRFLSAGIENYKAFSVDLTREFRLQQHVDLIIADLPCSGSGTWGRTPEQLLFFSATALKDYSTLQEKIIRNILPGISSGTYLLYITCSVYVEENEEKLEFMLRNSSLELQRSGYLTGYYDKADTLFAALLKAP